MSKPNRLESVVGEQTYFITSAADGRERYVIYPKYTELFIDSLYRYRGSRTNITSTLLWLCPNISIC